MKMQAIRQCLESQSSELQEEIDSWNDMKKRAREDAERLRKTGGRSTATSKDASTSP